MFLEEQRLFNIEFVKNLTKDKRPMKLSNEWNGICRICSGTNITEYQLKNHDYICRTCNSEKQKINYIKNKTKRKANAQKTFQEQRDDKKFRAKAYLNELRYRDRKKGFKRICDLTVEEYLFFLDQKCNYCDMNDVTGVDRIDNDKGHVKSNCVPCCHECNTARSDHFSLEEMKLIGQTIKNIKLARNQE